MGSIFFRWKRLGFYLSLLGFLFSQMALARSPSLNEMEANVSDSCPQCLAAKVHGAGFKLPQQKLDLSLARVEGVDPVDFKLSARLQELAREINGGRKSDPVGYLYSAPVSESTTQSVQQGLMTLVVLLPIDRKIVNSVHGMDSRAASEIRNFGTKFSEEIGPGILLAGMGYKFLENAPVAKDLAKDTAVALFVLTVANDGLKRLTNRLTPNLTQSSSSIWESAAGHKTTDMDFPSSHVTQTAAASRILDKYFPGKGIKEAGMVVNAATCFARMKDNVHYPSACVASVMLANSVVDSIFDKGEDSKYKFVILPYSNSKSTGLQLAGVEGNRRQRCIDRPEKGINMERCLRMAMSPE